jgi:hypothetical protein
LRAPNRENLPRDAASGDGAKEDDGGEEAEVEEDDEVDVDAGILSFMRSTLSLRFLVAIDEEGDEGVRPW